MNIPNIIDKLKCLVPLDDDGKDGEWWLHRKKSGRYTYTHDHLGDASEHLDRLQDEFWKLHATAIELAEVANLATSIVADIKRHVDGSTDGPLGFIARRIADFECLPNPRVDLAGASPAQVQRVVGPVLGAK